MLKTRITDLSSPPYPYTAPHIFLTNLEVNHNYNAFLTSPSDTGIMIKAKDAIVGDVRDDIKEKISAIPKDDPSKTMGLLTHRKTAVRLRCEISIEY